jgi:hypothetical protein
MSSDGERVTRSGVVTVGVGVIGTAHDAGFTLGTGETAVFTGIEDGSVSRSHSRHSSGYYNFTGDGNTDNPSNPNPSNAENVIPTSTNQ